VRALMTALIQSRAALEFARMELMAVGLSTERRRAMSNDIGVITEEISQMLQELREAGVEPDATIEEVRFNWFK